MKLSLPAGLGLVLAVLLLTACEQSYKDETAVLARVNGDPITEAAYQNYRNLLQAQQQTAIEDNEQTRTILLEQMVFNRLMTQEAENQGLHLKDDIHYAIEIQRDEVLIGAVARNYLKQNPVSEDDIKQRYEKLKNEKEYQVRHILVESEKQAGEILSQLKKKASFAALAKKHSAHTQSRNLGGKLDWIGRDFAVPAIFKAVSSLKKPGLVEEPVQSAYGWHVVRVDKVRAVKIPPLDSIKQVVVNQLQREKISQLGSYLRKGGKVEYIGKEK